MNMTAEPHDQEVEMNDSLTEVFRKLNQSGLEYSVISDWSTLPRAFPDSMVMLVKDADRVAQILGCSQFRATHPVISVSISTGNLSEKNCLVTLIEKGSGAFPEQFESRVLKRRVLHEDVVYVPDNEEQALICLYVVMRYGSWGSMRLSDKFESKMILDYLSNRVGNFTTPRIDLLRNSM